MARQDNKDAPTLKRFVEAYQTEEVYAAAVAQFRGGVIKGW